MLTHLTIKNYALIKQLEMNLSTGLSVITGETGAGKSIMLGAIGLLMGNRADTKVLWNENDKCVIEGTFSIGEYNLQKLFKKEDLDYTDETMIRREISPGGKSRAFINDTPVTLDVMKRIGHTLMDIHSQHETLLLGNEEFQLNLIDAYAGNATLRSDYLSAWENYLQAKEGFEQLNKEAATLREEADYVQFQLDELTKVNLQDGEQQTLEGEVKVAEHTEEIKTNLQQALAILQTSEYASQTSLAEARNLLQHISDFGASYETLFNRLNSLLIELDDIVGEIEKSQDTVDFDPERAEYVKERLSAIYRLQKKHRVNSIRELLDIQQQLDTKASLTSNLDGALENARKKLEEAEQQLHDIAKKLTTSRKKVFAALTKELVTLLKELGIPDAQLDINHQIIAPAPSGADAVELVFSANKGIALKPLAQVASGGEFSRVMFAFKYVMARKKAMPTLVLDEIDNGVSGEIAIKLGRLMKSMSANHQLITITHLPQIAAKGDAHYFVFKDNASEKTISAIKQLNEEERINEIAQMIGGATPSSTALQGARELLSLH